MEKPLLRGHSPNKRENKTKVHYFPVWIYIYRHSIYSYFLLLICPTWNWVSPAGCPQLPCFPLTADRPTMDVWKWPTTFGGFYTVGGSTARSTGLSSLTIKLYYMQTTKGENQRGNETIYELLQYWTVKLRSRQIRQSHGQIQHQLVKSLFSIQFLECFRTQTNRGSSVVNHSVGCTLGWLH